MYTTIMIIATLTSCMSDIDSLKGLEAPVDSEEVTGASWPLIGGLHDTWYQVVGGFDDEKHPTAVGRGAAG